MCAKRCLLAVILRQGGRLFGARAGYLETFNEEEKPLRADRVHVDATERTEVTLEVEFRCVSSSTSTPSKV